MKWCRRTGSSSDARTRRRLSRWLAATALIALALSITSASTSVPRQIRDPDKVVFLDVNLVSMVPGEAVRPHQTVIVRDGRITAIAPAGEIEEPTGATRIRAEDQYLLPGLADMHVHLEYFDDPRMLALFIANGVTLVRNMDGRPFILGWRDSTFASEAIAAATREPAGFLSWLPAERLRELLERLAG